MVKIWTFEGDEAPISVNKDTVPQENIANF